MTDIHKHQPKTDWQAWFKAFILLGMGLYFTILIVSGNLTNYINIRFAWLSYVAAIGFLALGIWSAWQLRKSQQHDHNEHDDDPHYHDHDHLHLSWGALGIVAIPLLMATLIPSQPLGVDAVSGGISLEPISGVSAQASFNLPPEERNVLDWLRTFNQTENSAELDGLPVNVIGFVYREPHMDETQFMVARFTLSCCVADALAIGLPVDFDNAPDFADGDWVQIEGILEAGQFDGELLPVIRPINIEKIDQPENPYLYS